MVICSIYKDAPKLRAKPKQSLSTVLSRTQMTFKRDNDSLRLRQYTSVYVVAECLEALELEPIGLDAKVSNLS